MLSVGERMPEATVWIGPRERVALPQLVADGAVLLVFYLFDWSAT